MTDVLLRDAAVPQNQPPARNGQHDRVMHHQVVIVGGGTAGIAVAARLRRVMRSSDVAILEPSNKHYYQPAWTLVGGGEYRKEDTERSEASLIPPGVTWIPDAVTEFLPEENAVLTRGGRKVTYDCLVVAAGIQVDWGKVKGLPETLGKNGVTSNYSYETCDTTWELIHSFRGGTALFTQPSTPIKCGGAPQKIMYLADDHFRRAGVRERSRVMFVSGTPGLFPVAHYAPGLEQVVRRKGIETLYRHDLVEVRAAAREAVFRGLDSGEEQVLRYDLLHVTPPMSAPDFIKRSPLAAADGWVEVDPKTLRHVRYANIFALGDASSLPTSKTGAAVRKQAPVAVHNLIAALQGKPLPEQYDGYTSCPLVTGYGKLILAEFDYDKKPKETFPFDQRRERWSMYVTKKRILPLVYWQGMMKGRL